MSKAPWPETRSESRANTSASSLTTEWLTGGSTGKRAGRVSVNRRTPSKAWRSSTASSAGSWGFEGTVRALGFGGAGGSDALAERWRRTFPSSLKGEGNTGLAPCRKPALSPSGALRFFAILEQPINDSLFAARCLLGSAQSVPWV